MRSGLQTLAKSFFCCFTDTKPKSPSLNGFFSSSSTKQFFFEFYEKPKIIKGIWSQFILYFLFSRFLLSKKKKKRCDAGACKRLARQEKRHDVCAQPFGINTPDLFSFVFNIMAVVTRGRLHNYKGEKVLDVYTFFKVRDNTKQF